MVEESERTQERKMLRLLASKTLTPSSTVGTIEDLEEVEVVEVEEEGIEVATIITTTIGEGTKEGFKEGTKMTIIHSNSTISTSRKIGTLMKDSKIDQIVQKIRTRTSTRARPRAILQVIKEIIQEEDTTTREEEETIEEDTAEVAIKKTKSIERYQSSGIVVTYGE